MNRELLAWAAGFYDGEGCTSARPDGYPTCQVAQVEFEPLARLQQAVGVGLIRGPIVRPNQRPFYNWQVNGYERVQHVITTLWPWLGTPKREQARAVLLRERARPVRRSTRPEGAPPPGERTQCPEGHEYDEDNTYIDPSGKRVCRACKRNLKRAARHLAGVQPHPSGPYGRRKARV